MSTLAPRHVTQEIRGGELESGGYAVQDYGQSFSVGFA
jgi:hypothetical protein